LCHHYIKGERQKFKTLLHMNIVASCLNLSTVDVFWRQSERHIFKKEVHIISYASANTTCSKYSISYFRPTKTTRSCQSKNKHLHKIGSTYIFWLECQSPIQPLWATMKFCNVNEGKFVENIVHLLEASIKAFNLLTLQR
jgi:hypothetical protein